MDTKPLSRCLTRTQHKETNTTTTLNVDNGRDLRKLSPTHNKGYIESTQLVHRMDSKWNNWRLLLRRRPLINQFQFGADNFCLSNLRLSSIISCSASSLSFTDGGSCFYCYSTSVTHSNSSSSIITLLSAAPGTERETESEIVEFAFLSRPVPVISRTKPLLSGFVSVLFRLYLTSTWSVIVASCVHRS